MKDYQAFARHVIEAIPDRPISFEVFADEFDEMELQALEMASWREKVAYHDSYVPVLDEDNLHLCNADLTEQVLQSKDCVVIVTPPSGVDWQWVVKTAFW